MPLPSAPRSLSRPSTAEELKSMFPEQTTHPRLSDEIKTSTSRQLLDAGEAETAVLSDESFQETYDVEKGKNRRGKLNTLADLDSQIQGYLDRQGQDLDEIGNIVFAKLDEALRSYIKAGLDSAVRNSDPDLRALLEAFLPDSADLPVLKAYISGRKAYLAAKVAQLYRDGAAPAEFALEDVLPKEISEEPVQVFVICAGVIRQQLIGHVEAAEKEEAEKAQREAEARKVREDAERKNKAVTDRFTDVAESLVDLNGMSGLSEQLLVDSRIKDFEIEFGLAVEKRFDIHDLPSFTPAPVSDRFGSYNQLAHKVELLNRANSGASSEQKEAARIQCGIELHRIVQDYLRQFLTNLKNQVLAAKGGHLPAVTAEVGPLFQGLEAKISDLLSPLTPADWAKRVEKATATIVAALPVPAPAPVVSGPAIPPPLPPRLPSAPAPVSVEPDWDKLNKTIADLAQTIRSTGTPLNIESIARQMLETLRGDLSQQPGEDPDDYRARLQNFVWPVATAVANLLQGFVSAPSGAAPDASDIAQAVVHILADDLGKLSVRPPEGQKSRLRRAGEGLLKLGAVAGFAVAFDKCDGTDHLVDGYHRMTASNPTAQVEAPIAPPAPVGGDVTPPVEPQPPVPTPPAPESTASTVDWVRCDHLEAIPTVRDGLPKCGDTDLAGQSHTDKLAFVQCIGATQQGGKAFGTKELGFANAAGTQPQIGTDLAYVTFKRSMSRVCADEGTGVYAIPVVKQ